MLQHNLFPTVVLHTSDVWLLTRSFLLTEWDLHFHWCSVQSPGCCSRRGLTGSWWWLGRGCQGLWKLTGYKNNSHEYCDTKRRSKMYIVAVCLHICHYVVSVWHKSSVFSSDMVPSSTASYLTWTGHCSKHPTLSVANRLTGLRVPVTQNLHTTPPEHGAHTSFIAICPCHQIIWTPNYCYSGSIFGTRTGWKNSR